MPQVDGLLGYFGLDEWWLTAFSASEREVIETVFQPLSTGGDRPLTCGRISATSETPIKLLSALIGWFKGAQHDPSIALRLISKLASLCTDGGDVLDRHFAYQAMLEWHYRHRETVPGSLDAAIEACERQIELAPAAAARFAAEGFGPNLPLHRGFEQLAIVREKQGRHAAAIALSLKALEQGWSESWETRIARCRKRMGD